MTVRNILKNTAILLGGSLLLRACVTTLTPTDRTIGPDTVVQGETPETTVINGVVQSDLVYNSSFDKGRLFYYGNGGTKHVYVGETASGGGYAAVGATVSAAQPYGSVIYGRSDDTEAPSSGTVAYAGDYAGVLRLYAGDPATSNDVSRLINGTATLTANFSNDTISGVISNRVLKQTGTNGTDFSNILTNVTLNSAAIDSNGAYSGTTIGGEINPGVSTWYTATGTFGGLIVGPTGRETVGGTRILHAGSGGGGTYIEYGAFIAE